MALLNNFKEDFHIYLRDIKNIITIAQDAAKHHHNPLYVNIINASIFFTLFTRYEDAIRSTLKNFIYHIHNSSNSGSHFHIALLKSHLQSSSIYLKNISKQEKIDVNEFMAFCDSLRKFAHNKTSILFADDICKNTHNIGSKELTDIFKRVGIPTILKRMASLHMFKKYYDTSNEEKIMTQIAADLASYNGTRNKIAHTYSFETGYGLSYISTFSNFARKIVVATNYIASSELLTHQI